jgi:hypothetical protein
MIWGSSATCTTATKMAWIAAALALSVGAATAAEEGKYPDLRGQWAGVLRTATGLKGQPSFDPSKSWGKFQEAPLWWRERRTLARKLLDIGDAADAYEVVRTAAPPANPYYRAEFHHMAGWIALRFLHDPAKAQKHFARADEGITRAAYWRGRAAEAAEAAGQLDEMRAQYQAAASCPVAYYGQLARARLGLDDVVELRSPPEPADAKTSEALRAAASLAVVQDRAGVGLVPKLPPSSGTAASD